MGQSVGKTVKRRIVKKAFYSDEEDESAEEEVEVGFESSSYRDVEYKDQSSEHQGVFANATEEVDVDTDHRLLLRSTLPLLKSRNSSVVLGVCSLHYYCGSQSSTTSQQIGKALVRILRNRREIQYIVLTCINTLAQERPNIFRDYVTGERSLPTLMLHSPVGVLILTMTRMMMSILTPLPTLFPSSSSSFTTSHLSHYNPNSNPISLYSFCFAVQISSLRGAIPLSTAC